MEQFSYTWCQPGQSVSGQSGWRVRAMSAGVQETRAQSLANRYAQYVFRDGRGNQAMPPKLALVRLEKEALLVHSAPVVGLVGGRPDVFFAHVICALPPDLDALEALCCWRSPAWRVKDGNDSSTLGQPGGLPSSQSLREDAVRADLRRPGRAEMAEFVLAALLALTGEKRVFIGGPESDVVNLVYSALRCLPLSLRRRLTFSTQEGGLTGREVKLVGVVFSNAPGQDLDSACYQGAGFGLNTISGRRSDVLFSPYAQLAVQCFCNNDCQVLDELHRVFESLVQPEPRDLDVLARTNYARPGIELGPQACLDLLASPALSRNLFTRPPELAALFRFMAADKELGERAVARLKALAERDKPALPGLVNWLVGLCAEALEENLNLPLEFVMDKVLPDLTGEPAANHWLALFRACQALGGAEREAPPDCQTRVTALLAWRGHKEIKDTEELRRIRDRWMRIGPANLPMVLKSELNDESKTIATRECCRRIASLRELPEQVYLELRNRRALLLAALSELHERGLLSQGQPATLPRSFHEAARFLLSRVDCRDILEPASAAMLAELQRLTADSLTPGEARRLQSVMQLGQFLRNPAGEGFDLSAIADAVSSPVPETRRLVAAQAIGQVVARCSLEQFEKVFRSLGAPLCENRRAFLEECLAEVKRTGKPCASTELATALFVLHGALSRSSANRSADEDQQEALCFFRALPDGGMLPSLARMVVWAMPLELCLQPGTYPLLEMLLKRKSLAGQEDEQRLIHFRNLALFLEHAELCLEHLTGFVSAYKTLRVWRCRQVSQRLLGSALATLNNRGELDRLLGAFLAELPEGPAQEDFLAHAGYAVVDQQNKRPEDRLAVGFALLCLGGGEERPLREMARKKSFALKALIANLVRDLPKRTQRQLADDVSRWPRECQRLWDEAFRVRTNGRV